MNTEIAETRKQKNCPECCGTVLEVAVAFTGAVACQFNRDGDFQIIDAVELDSTMHDEAACRCPNCGWQGEFRETGQEQSSPESSSSGAISNEEFSELVTAMERFNGESRRVATRLADEVRRLNLLLDSVTRLSSNESQDTTIG